MPIAGSYPIVTALLAVLFLGEPMTLRLALGILVVVAGVTLVAYPRGLRVVARPSESERVKPVGARVGVAMALGAALCWATSTVLVKPALEQVTPLVANAIRLPFGCIVLFVLASIAGRRSSPFAIRRRSLAVLAATGTISGFSMILWLMGVQLAGAAKAATLNSTAPVFAAPLAALVLGERLTAQMGIGIVLTVLGVWLVI
jgi:drug/metabolite transporter (DMT)-like permease